MKGLQRISIECMFIVDFLFVLSKQKGKQLWQFILSTNNRTNTSNLNRVLLLSLS